MVVVRRSSWLALVSVAPLALFACAGGAEKAATQQAHAPTVTRPLAAAPTSMAAGGAPASTAAAADDDDDPEAVAASPSDAPAGAATTTSTTSATITNVPARPALDHAQALHHFFEALARLEDGQGQGQAQGQGQGQSREDVRVVQLGDSHTAADIETGAYRHVLQQRFGDGGRGFVALGRPWSTYLQEAVRGGMTREWAGERGKLSHGQFVGDGRYGLAGFAIQTTRKNGRAWTDVSSPTSRIELAFLAQPRGGSFDFFVDGARAGRVSTRGKTESSGFHAFDVPEGKHHVEAVSVGDGEVRLFGMALDRAAAGVVVDAAGINGARAVNTLNWNEAHEAEQLRHRNPDLVVLAYGTNESGDDTTPQAYERQLVDVLGRVARAVPSASCLLLGPPDRAVRTSEGWTTLPKILEIVESQRKVAEAAGCAFFDQLSAMGGPGTMAQWAEEQPPRGRKDHVHMTKEGYTQLGQTFGVELLRAYVAWRAETGKPAPPSLVSAR